jgi:HlyD family secretion protein
MKRHGPLVIALVAAGCSQPPPDNLVRASGHVEATETRLAPDAGGRILTFDLEEGDRVEAGQQILTLDRRDADLSLAGARAEEAQADAQLRLLQAGSRPEEIRQAESQVAAALADLSAARAELVSAEQDLERFEALLTTNSGSRKQRDDAATRRGVSADRVKAAESRVRSAEEALNRLKAGARQQEIDAARARLAAARVRIASLEKAIADTTLLSPVGGIVTEKLVEVGEIIAPRTPVAVVTDLDRAWADVFVPEPAIPRLRLGQEARLFTDAGGAPLTGTVSYVSPKAEFTPRNVQTADERSRLVYRVRIAVDNREGVLKLGMPVDAELALSPQ